LGQYKVLTGSIDETIPLHEQAIRLSPRDPFISNQYIFIGQVNLLRSRGQEGIVWFERARADNPGSELAHAWARRGLCPRGRSGSRRRWVLRSPEVVRSHGLLQHQPHQAR